MRTAIVHEWIGARAGSEKVFERLAGLWPDADLYALDWNPAVRFDSGGRKVHTTVIDIETLRSNRLAALPFMYAAWKCVQRDPYDLVVSSHHCMANSFLRKGDKNVMSYVHTPGRYFWDNQAETRGKSTLLSPLKGVLRSLDSRHVDRVDAYIANSTEVKHRISSNWKRPASVVYPPVDVDFYSSTQRDASRGEYLLAFSRWVPYKRILDVIRVGEAAGLPVVVAGSGPLENDIKNLASSASVPVKIVRRPSDAELRDLYANAVALVFLAHEDFGIIPVEAQAAGCPVVCINQGGTLDTVIDGVTGIHVKKDATARQIANVIPGLKKISPDRCREHAQSFRPELFDKRIMGIASDLCDSKSSL